MMQMYNIQYSVNVLSYGSSTNLQLQFAKRERERERKRDRERQRDRENQLYNRVLYNRIINQLTDMGILK